MRLVLFILSFLIFADPAYAQADDPLFAAPTQEEEPQDQEKPLDPDTQPLPGAARIRKPLDKPARTNEMDYVTGPYYDMLVRQAITQRPKRFEFGTLRSYYTQMPQYDPLGDATRREMISLAFTIQNDEDPDKRKEAFDKYGALVSAHLGNFDVISQALVLSREDKIFGDPKFFEYMRAGLLRSIMYSGNGTSLVLAYDAMTLGEETALLKALRFRVLKTEPAMEGGMYYNMHEVMSPDHLKPFWVFVDVTKPMAFLEWQRQNEGNNFSIQAQ
jgi:hypothetical protein